MIEIIKQPWHWLVAGTLIGLIVPLLLLIGNKKLGISSSLRHLCAICIPRKIPFFQYEWEKEIWSLFFVTGILLGGFVATQFLSDPNNIVVSEATKTTLAGYGITDFSQIMPVQLFTFDNLFNLKGLVFFVLGGFMVGFGSRYAAGCTSGHSIMGIANLQWPSLIATCCFMIGGFFSTNVLLPLFFKLI
ncbi:YeeE/YedE family protein [Flavobacterium amnicola]|uniref:YeeE/YedE family protein n=1 Tax=Flavobacterium amnicola TaxID=2506422 RepID=A0A4Q1K1P0_9FLAO|nr:YeeE/YedE thiosulfate transporter family protein [Flavobacterium amnicola]RXR16324.1 YeeE/YedE family protein [Flavobacterium amnicola]